MCVVVQVIRWQTYREADCTGDQLMEKTDRQRGNVDYHTGDYIEETMDMQRGNVPNCTGNQMMDEKMDMHGAMWLIVTYS